MNSDILNLIQKKPTKESSKVNSTSKNITKTDSPKTQLSLFDNMLQSVKTTKLKDEKISQDDKKANDNKAGDFLVKKENISIKNKENTQKQIVSTNLKKIDFNNKISNSIAKDEKISQDDKKANDNKAEDFLVKKENISTKNKENTQKQIISTSSKNTNSKIKTEEYIKKDNNSFISDDKQSLKEDEKVLQTSIKDKSTLVKKDTIITQKKQNSLNQSNVKITKIDSSKDNLASSSVDNSISSSVSFNSENSVTNIKNIAKRVVDIVVKNKKDLSSVVDETDAKQTIENLSKSDQDKIFKNVSKKLVSIIVADKKKLSSSVDQISKESQSNKKSLKIKDDNLSFTSENKNSLMDNIISKLENDTINKSNTNNIKKTNSSNNELKSNTDTLKANIFLSSQKHDQTITSTKVVKDVKETIVDKQTLTSIKEGASTLQLNPTNVDLFSQNEEGSFESFQKAKEILDDSVKKEDKKAKEIKEQKGNIARSFFNSKISEDDLKSIDKSDIEKEFDTDKKDITLSKNKDSHQPKKVDNLQNINIDKNNNIKIVNETDATIKSQKIDLKDNVQVEEKVINLNVPANEANILKNKIIGAQQKMGSLMSDVAKKMYQNYKPPVTAMRINLTPDSLGSISVVMRSNKSDNSLKVSMSMSNRSTMDVFADNKSSLQNALLNNVGSDANISLDFGMQQDSSQGNQQQSGFESFESSNQTLNNKVTVDEELVDIVDSNIQSNYM